jgi:intein-encoded DNA endonuclease-like protein
MAGNLDTVLLSWRESGRSYRDIAELVEWQTGVSVSKSTVYQWLVLQG